MKREINLIPPDYVDRLQRRRDASIAVALAVGCCAVLALSAHLLLSSVAQKTREAEELRQKIQTLRSQRMELVALASEKERILDELTQLVDLLRDDPWGEPLAELAQAPESVLLVSVQAADLVAPTGAVPTLSGSMPTSRRVVIGGWALSNEELGRFISALNESGQYGSVQVELTRLDRFRGIEAVQFQLSCIVTGSAGKDSGEGESK